MLSLSIVLKMLKQYNQIKIHNQFSHQILESFYYTIFGHTDVVLQHSTTAKT